VAEVYGVEINDYARSPSSLPHLPGLPTCSVAFYPANRTASQHSILSRNLDMPVEMNASRPHSCSRPVLFEVEANLLFLSFPGVEINLVLWRIMESSASRIT
jgi:hypothetical protein